MTHVPRSSAATAEELRFQEARAGVSWRTRGPYLSERQWGTVREDHSEDGEAWSCFTHDQARSRAYRCGDDGLAGISLLVFRWCRWAAFPRRPSRSLAEGGCT
jgi:hypothetical protein